MKLWVYIILFLATIVEVSSQEISWVKFEDLNDSLRVNEKPLMIFIHAEWCKYCKIQENTTFKDSAVIEKLNKQFYCLKLNAETSDSIQFLNRIYIKSNTSYHELANFLGAENKTLTFPTTVFLDENYTIKEKRIGLIRKEDLIK